MIIIIDVSSHDCKEKNAGDSSERTSEISSKFFFDDFWFVSYYPMLRKSLIGVKSVDLRNYLDSVAQKIML